MLLSLMAALLATGTSWDASLRTEGRGGNVPTASSTAAAPTGGALQLNAAVRLSGLLDEDWAYALTYAPRYLQQSASQGAPNELMNVGGLGLTYRISGISHLSFNESFSYGQQDYSNLLAAALAVALPGGTTTPGTTTPGTTPPGTTPGTTPPGAPGTSPTGQTTGANDSLIASLLPISLVYLSSSTSAGFDTALTHRLSFNLNASYFLSGGADAPARVFLPLQRGVTVSSGLGYTVDRDDNVSGSVTGTGSRFSDGSQAETAAMQLGWRHNLGPATGFNVGLGVGAGTTQGGVSPAPTVPFPVAGASLSHSVALKGGSVSGSLNGTLTPSIDPITGGVYELVTGGADASWSPRKELRFNAHFGGGHALSGSRQQGQELIQAELSTSIVMSERASFSFGGRMARVEVPEQTVADPLDPTGTHRVTTAGAFHRLDWGVFAAVTFGARGAL